MTVAVTVNVHSYGVLTEDGWRRYSHNGPCTRDNCEQYQSLHDAEWQKATDDVQEGE